MLHGGVIYVTRRRHARYTAAAFMSHGGVMQINGVKGWLNN